MYLIIGVLTENSHLVLATSDLASDALAHLSEPKPAYLNVYALSPEGNVIDRAELQRHVAAEIEAAAAIGRASTLH